MAYKIIGIPADDRDEVLEYVGDFCCLAEAREYAETLRLSNWADVEMGLPEYSFIAREIKI